MQRFLMGRVLGAFAYGLWLWVSPPMQASDHEWLVRVGLERQAMGKEIFVQSIGGAFRWVDIETGRTLSLIHI